MDEQSPGTKQDSEDVPKSRAKPLRPMRVIGGWIAGLTLMMALLAPLVLKAREAARRTVNKNNLKQLGLALHNYHDTYAVLPPGGSIREDGTPHHGWMTSVMPQLKIIHLQTIHKEVFDALKSELLNVQIVCNFIRE